MSTGMKVQLRGIDEVMAALNPKAYEGAIKAAVHDTGKTIRTRLSSSIRDVYTVKKKRLDRNIQLYLRDKKAELHISSDPISINAFSVTAPTATVKWTTKHGKTRRIKRRVVSVKIRKDSKERKRVGFFLHGEKGNPVMLRKLRYNPGATVAEKREARRKLRKMYGMSAAAMTNNDRVREMLELAKDIFDRRFEYWWNRKAWGVK